jgi:hypothetical protein
MTGQSRSPRFDLAAAQKAAVRIGDACARRAAQALQVESIDEARAHALALFKSLVPSDFAHCEHMRGRDGSTRYGDVYGKRDDVTLWFIKIEFDGKTTTIVMSCHEAEHGIQLADGRTLRLP